MLAAGLDGIRKGMSAPESAEENPYMADNQRRAPQDFLPESLNRALDALEEDQVIREALGPHIFDRFINAKRLEWQEWRLEVTSWELEKYLTSY